MSDTNHRAIADRIIWIDCEMTGLSLKSDALVEVAALVTDFELNQLGDGIDVVVKPPDEALEQMDDFVRDMHTSSGLHHRARLAASPSRRPSTSSSTTSAPSSPSRARPRSAATPWPPTAASSSRDMPVLESYLHYRIIDVSSIKELSRRWYPRVYFNAPKKSGGHRALADIRESIAELRYYREAVFVPQPGPDSATAKALAVTARHRALTLRRRPGEAAWRMPSGRGWSRAPRESL